MHTHTHTMCMHAYGSLQKIFSSTLSAKVHEHLIKVSELFAKVHEISFACNAATYFSKTCS